MKFVHQEMKFVPCESKNEEDIVGTAEYASPEMLSHSVVDSRSTDIWALGCILYLFFHGKTPFKAESDAIIFDNILKLKYSMKSDIPIEVRDLISHLLTLNPEERIVYDSDFSKIKKHPFFKGIDFENLHCMQVPFRINPRSNVSREDLIKFNSNNCKIPSVSEFEINVSPFNLNRATVSHPNSPMPFIKTDESIMNMFLNRIVKDYSIDNVTNNPVIIEDYYTSKLSSNLNDRQKEKILKEGLVKKVSFISDKLLNLKLYPGNKLELWDYKKQIKIVTLSSNH